MKLVLLRHGESTWNLENRFTGWTDVPLSAKGREEALAAGDLLKAGGYDFDLCYTSYLKRAIQTLNGATETLDRMWLPVLKDWRLNERHYGALQGLNKSETAQQYGDEQVKIWRRSYDVPPPELTPEDPRAASSDPAYRDVDPAALPLAESLKDTIARVVPYYEEEMLPRILAGKRLLVVAHGNSLRALVKYLDGLSEAEIMEVNIPTGIPLVYDLDELGRSRGNRYLGDPEMVRTKMAGVAAQGSAKK